MKNHTFSYLDGLRGLAAILVMMSHNSPYFGLWPHRAYLAVDVFFLLSGFVIAHAYDQKIVDCSLSFKKFVKKRIFRLYPAFFLSLVIAFTLSLITAVSNGQVHFIHFTYLFLATLLFIPVKLFGGMLFSLNPPYWSLFFEFLVNFSYALIRPKFALRALGIIVMASGLFLIYIAMTYHQLNVGFGRGLLSILGGLARAIFGIFLGIILYHSRIRILDKLPKISPWLAICVIMLALLTPRTAAFNGTIDLIFILFIFPLMIVIASQHRKTRFNYILLKLGAASYPLYVLHFPITKFITFIIEKTGHGKIITAYAPYTGILITIFMLWLSLITVRFFETPARSWLASSGISSIAKFAFARKS